MNENQTDVQEVVTGVLEVEEVISSLFSSDEQNAILYLDSSSGSGTAESLHANYQKSILPQNQRYVRPSWGLGLAGSRTVGTKVLLKRIAEEQYVRLIYWIFLAGVASFVSTAYVVVTGGAWFAPLLIGMGLWVTLLVMGNYRVSRDKAYCENMERQGLEQKFYRGVGQEHIRPSNTEDCWRKELILNKERWLYSVLLSDIDKQRFISVRTNQVIGVTTVIVVPMQDI